MQKYANKQALIDEITIQAKLFIHEFHSVNDLDKNILVDKLDRAPSQMILPIRMNELTIIMGTR